MVPIEDRMILWTSDNMSVQVDDGRRYLVDAITMARIVNAQSFRETVSADLDACLGPHQTRLDAALRQTYGKRTFEAALSKDRTVMMREIRDQVRAEALNNGIEIVDVRIVRTDLMDEVLKNTYERMSSERIAEAKDLRGRGEARKIEIMAQADRAYTEKLADARRQSEVIRGEGEGERNKIFAEAFQQDPEFFCLLPLDAGLCEEPVEHWHDAGAEARFGLLQISRHGQERRRAAPAMSDFVTALGLVLVIEGLLYAFVPGHLKAVMALMQSTPDDSLRMGGLVATAVGVALVWLARAVLGGS